MGSWRNRLAQDSYTIKVGGSSPSLPTILPNGVTVARPLAKRAVIGQNYVRNYFKDPLAQLVRARNF